MQAQAVEPMNIVRQLQSQFFNRRKDSTVDKFSLNRLKSGLCNRIIVGASPHAKRSVDMKSLQYIINQLIIELFTPIGMKHLNVKETAAHARKSFLHQPSIFVKTCAEADDLTAVHLKQYTDICPPAAHANVGQIADHTAIGLLLVELSVKQIGCGALVAGVVMHPVLFLGIDRNEAVFTHDFTDFPTRNALAVLLL